MEKGLAGIAILFAALLLLPQAYGAGCSVLTQAGYEPDYDCDGVIDAIDNCPAQRNPSQHDLDRNRIGDACDSVIEEIIVQPDTRIEQGEFAHVLVRIINNGDADLADVTVMVRNRELGFEADHAIPFLPRGEAATAEFWLRVPKCAAVKTYPLSVSAQAGGHATDVKTEQLTVLRGDACGTPDSPLDTTRVTVFAKADLDRGDTILTPITITNAGERQATYHIAVRSFGDWGTWRIDPAPTLTLPAGHEDTVYLYMKASPEARPGLRTIDLVVTSDGQTTTVPFKVYVRAPVLRGGNPWLWLLIVVLIALLLAALALALWRANRAGPERTKPAQPAVKALPRPAPKAKRITARKRVAIEDARGRKFQTRY